MKPFKTKPFDKSGANNRNFQAGIVILARITKNYL